MTKLKSRIDLKSIQVLHLEDMQPIHNQMKSDLKKIGIEKPPYHGDTVQKALLLCQEKSDIDLIISDWNLPDKTGMDFLKALRASKKFETTPFIMCTTMDEVENLINAINEGANEYLVKPWDIEDLQEKILQVLSNRS